MRARVAGAAAVALGAGRPGRPDVFSWLEAPPPVGPSPRVVLGMPAHDRPGPPARTIESLLSQTFTDFALVIADDAPSAATRAVVESYARDWPHITYEANRVRLGMIGNWRRVFERGRQLYPQ